MQDFRFLCSDVNATQALGRILGEVVKGGEVIEMISDIGGGKTVFVKGLAKGMGVADVVQSPTFTISQLHHGTMGRELHHFDFYRLTDPGIMRAELAESLAQPNAIVAIEWSDIVHDILPKDHIAVTLKAQNDDMERLITITVPEKLTVIRQALGEYQNKKDKA